MNEKTNYETLWSQAWTELQRVGPLTHSNHRLIIKQVQPFLVAGARLLDVGCGNGALLAKIAWQFPAVHLQGIEGSAEAVARAPQILRGKIIRQDLSGGFALGGEPFDIIICSEVLEHIAEYRPTLASIAAHTRPGGHVLITVPHAMRYWSKADEFAGHYRRFEFNQLREEMRGCDLEPLDYYTWGFPVAYFYYRLVSQIEPNQLMRAGGSRLKEFAAKTLYHAMKVDDLFTGTRWHQQIALARKQETPCATV
jgi:SAM-dependent methyltransferase